MPVLLQFVDGGHTLRVATADLAHTRLLANRTYHVLLLDDVLPGTPVEEAWRFMVRRLAQGGRCWPSTCMG